MATASKVDVPTVSSVQASIDNNQLTTGAGTVQRQVTSIGDPTTAANIAAVDSVGALLISAGTITATETNATITSSSSTVLASNSSAKYRYIQNTSATPAWMSLTTTAVVGSFMYIGPYGSFEMSKAAGNLVTGIIKAISTGGSITFYCLEGT